MPNDTSWSPADLQWLSESRSWDLLRQALATDSLELVSATLGRGVDGHPFWDIEVRSARGIETVRVDLDYGLRNPRSIDAFGIVALRVRTELANRAKRSDHPETGDRYRHVARGTFYRVMNSRATMQCEGSLDNVPIVVYAEEDGDGRVWVRPLAEFTDGRFVREVSVPPTRRISD